MGRAFDSTDAWMGALVLMWGTAFAALKVLLEDLDPYTLTWYRYVPFLLLYGAWLPFARRARFRALTGGDWVRVAAAGALGVLGYHLPLNWGMHGPDAISAATGSILVATTPLWTLLVAVLVGQERFSGAKALGSTVAFSGVAVIVFLAPAADAEMTVAARALVVLVAPVAWGLYSIIAKPVVTRHGGLFTTGLTFCVGTLMLLPTGLARGAAPLTGLDTAGWWWLAFLTLGATVGGYTIWNQALKRRAATEVTAYIYLIPVVATLAGWLVVGEAITAWFVLGAGLVLAGVIQVNRARARPAAAEAAPQAGT